jgi:hypothetical protein
MPGKIILEEVQCFSISIVCLLGGKRIIIFISGNNLRIVLQTGIKLLSPDISFITSHFFKYESSNIWLEYLHQSSFL